MDDPARSGPLRFFLEVPDPRAANVQHRLIDIFVMSLMAMICDADGWEQIADFARAKASWFATFMDLEHGTPSADTFRRVLGRLDPDAFEQAFMNWMHHVVEQSQGRLLAVDGKSLRRSFEHGWDKDSMAHMVGVFAACNGQTLGQLKTRGRGHELEGIRRLLGMIDLRGATVTIDAIACQKDVARQIIDDGGNYLLAVKENQKTLYRRIKVEMDHWIQMKFKGTWHDRHQDIDTGHGRIETRRVWVTDELKDLEMVKAWPGLRSIICVEALREVIGQEPSVERRYYISSCQADAEQLGEAIRGHWGIENRLHHVLDVTFHEDDCRVRKQHGPENLSRLRRTALNLLRNAGHVHPRTSIRRRRKIAGWDHDVLLRLITG